MDFGVLSGMVVAALSEEWRKERVDCFLTMLRGIFETQSVNTYRLAQRIGSGVRKDEVQFESQAQRIRRFLAEQKFNWETIGKLLLQVAGVTGNEKLVVAVDRTNWDFGKTAINFLVISVRVFGVGVPVVWTQLNKHGNSRTKERVDLLERFLEIVPASRIEVFLADREFIGKTWFKALQQLNIPYAIRVRNNQFVVLPDGQKIKCSELAKALKKNDTAFYPAVSLDGVACSLSLKRLDEKDILAVVAFGLADPKTALDVYRLRWSIELCFACLKTKGFNIEDTHLRHPERLEKIFALAALAAAAALRASLDSKTSTRKKSMASLPDLSSCAA